MLVTLENRFDADSGTPAVNSPFFQLAHVGLQGPYGRPMKVEAVGDRARKPTKRAALPSFKDFSTKSPAMEICCGWPRKLPPSDIPILIEGEFGAARNSSPKEVTNKIDNKLVRIESQRSKVLCYHCCAVT